MTIIMPGKGAASANTRAGKKRNKHKLIALTAVLAFLLLCSAVPVGNIPLLRNFVTYAFGVPGDVLGSISFAGVLWGAANGNLAERYGYDKSLNYHADGGAYRADRRFLGAGSIVSPFALSFDPLNPNADKPQAFNSRAARSAMRANGDVYPEMAGFAGYDPNNPHNNVTPDINSLILSGQNTKPAEMPLVNDGSGMGPGGTASGGGVFTKPRGAGFIDGFGKDSSLNKAYLAAIGKINNDDEDDFLHRVSGGRSIRGGGEGPLDSAKRAYIYAQASQKSKYAEVKKELAELAFNGAPGIEDEFIFTSEKPTLPSASASVVEQELDEAAMQNKMCSNAAVTASDAMETFYNAVSDMGEPPKCHQMCENSKDLDRPRWNNKLNDIVQKCRNYNAEVENMKSKGCPGGPKMVKGDCAGLADRKVKKCNFGNAVLGFFTCPLFGGAGVSDADIEPFFASVETALTMYR